MKIFIVIVSVINVISAQDARDDAINSIFSTDFLDDYEEVTKPPLKSIGALSKCGEDVQQGQFVCVPYYNCNPTTKLIELNPDVDGANKIDVRMGDDDNTKCDHYLDVCCQVPPDFANNTNNGNVPTPTVPVVTPTVPVVTPTVPVVTPTVPVVTPTESSESPISNNTGTIANCGIRNADGLDFNLLGRTNEANYGEFPWMMAILRKNPSANENLAICGGSLIAPSVVLTGAHCVYTTKVNEIKIRGGEWDSQTINERIPYQERNVVRKIVHESFIPGNLYNDVALLLLDKPFAKTDTIGTICLPNENQRFPSRNCFATGWGKDTFGKDGRYAVILKKIQLPLVSKTDCQAALRKTRLRDNFVLHRSFTCAGGEANLDTCTGDGGSPLVCSDPQRPTRYLQVGIVAWGIGCGENQIPGVYGDVAYFRNWIDLKLQEIGIPSASYTQ